MDYPGTGSAFGRYDIGERLGQGGMGMVFRAVHRDLDRPVALKLLSPTLIAAESYRERFLREARVLARLDTPHVVRVHDAGDEDGWLFIATELIAGGDLQRQLEQHGPLPPPLALRLVAESAQGLAVAHAAGVLHRDLKPSNVLLRPREDGAPSAVLCDLGIAKAEADDGLTTTGLIGTPTYMAPERHDGQPASQASDLYELGCVLWALLTGQAPYTGTWGQVAIAHLQAPVPQLSDDHPAASVNPLLARMLAKSPAARFGSAAELGAAAREAAERSRADPPGPLPATPPAGPTVVRSSGEPPAPAPPPLVGSPTPAARRRRGPALVAAAVLALVVGVTAVVLLVTRDDPDTTARGGGATTSTTEDSSSDPSDPTSEATSEPPDTEPTGPGLPSVGDCYLVDDSQARRISIDAAPTDCSSNVTMQTVLVARLDSRNEGQLAALAADCLPALAEASGVNVAQLVSSVLTPNIFFPNDRQWEAGARWWRCDASAYVFGRLAPIPPALGQVFDFEGIAGAPYDACLDAAGARLTCQDASTEFAFAAGFVQRGPASWPGDERLDRIALERCKPIGVGYKATWPGESSWEQGVRYVVCWRPI